MILQTTQGCMPIKVQKFLGSATLNPDPEVVEVVRYNSDLTLFKDKMELQKKFLTKYKHPLKALLKKKKVGENLFPKILEFLNYKLNGNKINKNYEDEVRKIHTLFLVFTEQGGFVFKEYGYDPDVVSFCTLADFSKGFNEETALEICSTKGPVKLTETDITHFKQATQRRFGQFDGRFDRANRVIGYFGDTFEKVFVLDFVERKLELSGEMLEVFVKEKDAELVAAISKARICFFEEV